MEEGKKKGATDGKGPSRYEVRLLIGLSRVVVTVTPFTGSHSGGSQAGAAEVS